MALARIGRRRRRSAGAEAPGASSVVGPLLWFAAASLVAVLALGFSATAVLRRQARGEAIRDAKEITRLAGEGIAEPALGQGVVAGDQRAQARFGRLMRQRVVRDPVVRVKVWSLDGRIVYSDKRALVGRRFELEPEALDAVRRRLVHAEVSDLGRPENRFERRFGKLLEVYLPVEARDGEPLVFEDYIRFASVTAGEQRLFSRFAPALAVALLLLWLVQLPLAWSITRRLQRRQREREALLQRALDSSALERRRIARHLHDGVVQDLAGVSYGLSATAGDLEHSAPRPARVVGDAAAAIRRAVRELRGLLIGIYPPSLQRAGLRTAVLDLLAPLSARGIAVEAEVPDDLGLAPETAELIFRSAQEAVRNVAKHADAERVELTVRRSNGLVVMTVSDDGRGFEPAAEADPGGRSLGLQLLDDLVREHRGRLEVRSQSGRGTVVTLELDAR
jgi:two-component system, NarL family, sensor kinase